MRYREIGATGLKVSVVGFGAWGIGGKVKDGLSYGRTDDAVSRRALAAAFDHGITLYDTAPLYGLGHSEALIGQVFSGRRDRIVIATKVGYSDFSRRADFTPAAIRQSVEDSLQRLRTDYIDILQLHDASPEYLRQHPETLSALDDLRREGKLRLVGASVKLPADGVPMIQEHGLRVIQANLSMMDRRCFESGLLDAARVGDAGVIARTPLHFGFLTGQLTGSEEFGPDDHRSRWSRQHLAQWANDAKRLLIAAGWQPGRSAIPFALRFVLSCPGVATTIPGILSPEQATENAACGALDDLPASLMASIADCYNDTSASSQDAVGKRAG
ncbi:aldo/keto reductase [Ferrovibrio terrae]|uniref:aldo/keto reductase n=1 Tax=Ferrovibrio terrae TaxID=2594003 RepID=UPI003137D45D